MKDVLIAPTVDEPAHAVVKKKNRPRTASFLPYVVENSDSVAVVVKNTKDKKKSGKKKVKPAKEDKDELDCLNIECNNELDNLEMMVPQLTGDTKAIKLLRSSEGVKTWASLPDLTDTVTNT